MTTYACYNRSQDFQDYPAQDGWFYEYSSMTRKPKIVQIPHVMSKECRYDKALTDKQCKGCRHRPVDAEFDSDFREVARHLKMPSHTAWR